MGAAAMSTQGMPVTGLSQRSPTAPGAARLRALVVFASGRAGGAALACAAALARAGAQLQVVTLAPQARPYRCCGGGGPGPYNCAVRDVADADLARARALLGPLARDARFTTLAGSPSPPLAAWCSERAFDVIVLPAPRLARGGGRLARELRRETAARVRLVR